MIGAMAHVYASDDGDPRLSRREGGLLSKRYGQGLAGVPDLGTEVDPFESPLIAAYFLRRRVSNSLVRSPSCSV